MSPFHAHFVSVPPPGLSFLSPALRVIHFYSVSIIHAALAESKVNWPWRGCREVRWAELMLECGPDAGTTGGGREVVSPTVEINKYQHGKRGGSHTDPILSVHDPPHAGLRSAGGRRPRCLGGRG